MSSTVATSLMGLLAAGGVVLGTGLLSVKVTDPASPPTAQAQEKAPVRRDLPDFLGRGLAWLIEAQHVDGGWGAGSHSRQDVRDPSAVQTDPATTAFVGLALARAGHTPVEGAHRENAARALEYLVKAVETSGEGPKITKLEGTQPQSKMGPLVDTSLAVQFFARVVPALPATHPMRARADAAWDKALAKLQKSQTKDGEWGGGGWANALQGSLGAVALESSAAGGKPVPAGALAAARKTQQGRLDASGKAEAADAAGIELYAWAGAGRNAAAQSFEAKEIVERAKDSGLLAKEATVSFDSLRKAGVAAPEAAMLSEAHTVATAQTKRLDDQQLLNGFGNNGGEEFLSYMMTSEALVIGGGDAWTAWKEKMTALATKVQSADGSWTGHHCITSPVFCTAAVLQALTADFDADVLRAKQAKDGKDAKGAGERPRSPR
jgi:hypothetical protein